MRISAIQQTQNNSKINIKTNHKAPQKSFVNAPSTNGVSSLANVSFSGLVKISPNTKMRMYAEQLLTNLKENQKVFITADSKYLPFMNILSETAYKKGSGKVQYQILEPELEALKKKYNITEDFDYKKTQKETLKGANALFFNFSTKNNPYKLSGLTSTEEAKEVEKVQSKIPQRIYGKFKINPQEIFKDALDLKDGQSVCIIAEREHLPFVTKLVDYLYSKNKTKLVNVSLSGDENVSMLKYAKDSVLEEFPTIEKLANEEFTKRDTAYLEINAGFQNAMKGVPTERITKWSKTRSAALAETRNIRFNETPWLIYYIPTTKTCLSAYPEIKDPLKAIETAYIEANKINRTGAFGEHRKNLIDRTNKMNDLVKKGFRTFHYESFDPKTGKPDGKTNFDVTLSPKSMFTGPLLEYKKNNHLTIPNIPTEESFSAPLANSANGKIAVTKPLLINEKLVDGITLEFKDGKVVKVSADKNEDVLKEFISAHKNADRLGEVALVADSPIAKTGRFFNTTLVDENATCHLALGKAYSSCIEGASDIADYKECQKFLKQEHINISPVHKDFMVGGNNVKITAINPTTGKTKTLIENDKFMV